MSDGTDAYGYSLAFKDRTAEFVALGIDPGVPLDGPIWPNKAPAPLRKDVVIYLEPGEVLSLTVQRRDD